jgi:hypothetical protein
MDEGNVTSREPLALWGQSHWELRGVRDAVLFFSTIGALGGSDLFLEGSSQPPAVQQVLAKHCTPGPYLPERQTIWRPPEGWRLPCTADVLLELARLAESHAEPELADHVFIYGSNAALVEWPDAFAPDSPILISGVVPEDVVRALATRLAGTVRWIDGAVQQGDEAGER